MTIQEYIQQNDILLKQFLSSAWRWCYGSDCRSNRVDLDVAVCARNPRAAPQYAYEYLRHVQFLGRPSTPILHI